MWPFVGFDWSMYFGGLVVALGIWALLHALLGTRRRP
jgi:hypothetical protein